jgi:hydroxymethylbilane synthase
MSPYTALIRQINHLETFYCAMAELTVMKVLDGNCHSAVGVLAQITGDCITLEAINYENMKEYKLTGKMLDYKKLGELVGKQIK